MNVFCLQMNQQVFFRKIAPMPYFSLHSESEHFFDSGEQIGFNC